MFEGVIEPINARVICPVAPVRADKSDKSELVTQYLYGEPVIVTQVHQQWRYCKSEVDQYSGWVDEKMLLSGQQEIAWSHYLLQSPLQRLETPFGIKMLPAGSRHPAVQAEKTITEKGNGTALVTYAKQFLGAPYLWGGKTILGMDCSGLTQLVCAVNGIWLPRDASQQIEVGEPVDFPDLCENGDLAYFGKDDGSITHVGFVIKDGSKPHHEIIHAAGEVRIDRFDHQGIYREDIGEYTHKLRLIKRIVA